MLSGYPGSGKDFFYLNRDSYSDYFALNHNPAFDTILSGDTWHHSEIIGKFKRYAFADRLKKSLRIPIDHRITSDERAKILQEASLVKRRHGSDIFAKLLCWDIAKKNEEYVMITDLRFPEEITTLTDFFPDSIIRLVRVYSEHLVKRQSLGSLGNLDAAAEESIDYTNFHYTLYRLHHAVND